MLLRLRWGMLWLAPNNCWIHVCAVSWLLMNDIYIPYMFIIMTSCAKILRNRHPLLSCTFFSLSRFQGIIKDIANQNQFWFVRSNPLYRWNQSTAEITPQQNVKSKPIHLSYNYTCTWMWLGYDKISRDPEKSILDILQPIKIPRDHVRYYQIRIWSKWIWDHYGTTWDLTRYHKKWISINLEPWRFLSQHTTSYKITL
jgi:hypothetical protein